MTGRKRIFAVFLVLCLAAFIGAGIAAAQEAAAKSDAAKAAADRLPVAPTNVGPPRHAVPAARPRSPLVVLYDQNDNLSTNGASTQNFEEAYDVYDDYAADDFVVVGGWTVSSIVFPGFWQYAAPDSFNVTFFSDAGGVPGDAVCDYTDLAYVEDPSGTFTITFSPECVLTPGVKWVSVQANLDYAVGGQFYWYQRTVQSNGPAQWENPNGGFGSCTEWGPLTTCLSGTDPDLAFTLNGVVNSCGGDADCNDNNLCTTDACVSGNCVHTAVTCQDDGLFCTLETCLPATGCHPPNTCDDGNPCTQDTCNETTDTCEHQTSCYQVCNTGSVSIPSVGAATPYPSSISVSGLGAISSLASVQLNCLSHTWPADLDLLLVGPLGQNAIIMSDVGSSYDLVCVNLTLSDSATASLPTSSQITSGTYLPTNSGTGDTFPTPAPTPSGGSALSVFNGLNPNGTWQLYVVDDASGDSGSMTGGWCVTIAIASCSADSECNDNNPCTNDACVNTQCVHTNNQNSCDDGNACTLNDVCSGGTCGGTPKDCNDNDACTVDSCNTQTGACIYTAKVCDDLNPCTDNLCNAQTGCYYLPDNGLSCSDNNLCTTDACVNGACVGTLAVFCGDGNSCTIDSCVPSTGQCAHAAAPVGSTCACSVGGTCQCTGGNASENFDSATVPALPTGWSDSPAGSWATENTVSDTAPNAAFSDDPAASSDKSLVSQIFTADSSGTQVTFRHEYAFEGSTGYCFDGGVMEISIAAGAWQDIITAGGSWVTGGYNGTIYSGYGNALAGRAGWCLTSSGAFTTTTVSLPAAAAGQAVQLRWRLGSDSSVGATGWYIDTLTIPICSITCSGGTPVAVPPVGNSLVVTHGGGGGGGALVAWAGAAPACNVYRGTLMGSFAYNHTCLDRHNTTSQTTDNAMPSAGQSFYYVVTQESADYCESAPGYDSGGAAEPIPSPCP